MNYIMPLVEILSSRPLLSVREEDLSLNPASVLMPLFIKNGELNVLFTRRSDLVAHHKGQISFPGGCVDDKDTSFEETALREADEEIGLAPEDVTILGQLDYTITEFSNFIVYPFVGLIPYPYDFRLNTSEVDRLVCAPFEAFLSGTTLKEPHLSEFKAVSDLGPAYQYQGEVIWGATAKIIHNLVGIMEEKFNLPGR
ncbi:MAG: CoA pyrophosphatase [Deltaproteobacteria bacterium]|nr:CoA pyrophosphatase [Deltaproteobacteria bacterium]